MPQVKWPVTVVFLAGCTARDEGHVRWSQSIALEVSRSTEWLTKEFVEWMSKLRVRRALRKTTEREMACR
jgi:hypothetical protein